MFEFQLYLVLAAVFGVWLYMLFAIFFYTSPKHQLPVLYPTTPAKYLLIFVLIIPTIYSFLFSMAYYFMQSSGMIVIELSNRSTLNPTDYFLFSLSRTFPLDVGSTSVIVSSSQGNLVFLLHGFTNFLYTVVFISSIIAILFSVRMKSALSIEPKGVLFQSDPANIELRIVNSGEIPVKTKVFLRLKSKDGQVNIIDYSPKELSLNGGVLWSEDMVRILPGPDESKVIRLRVKTTKSESFRIESIITEDGCLPITRNIKVKHAKMNRDMLLSSAKNRIGRLVIVRR